MEPMSLGSPMSSPMQGSNSPGNSSAYLPSFLLGESNTVRIVFISHINTVI